MKPLYATVFFSLCAGLLLYVGFRTEKTLVNQLCIHFGGYTHFIEIRSVLMSLFNPPSFVKYSLPGALWVFAITLISKPVQFTYKTLQFPLVIVPLLWALGFELFQYWGCIRGVFDWADVLGSVLFWLLGIAIFPNFKSNWKHLPISKLHRTVCVLSYAVVYLAHVNP